MKHKLVFTLFGAMLIFALWNCQNQDKKPAAMGAAPPMSYGFAEARFRSYCDSFPAPAGATNTFELSQNYPDSFDVNEPRPWEKIDFKTNYKAYMNAILAYCMEGNLEVDFKVQNNKVRKWYTSPWMDTDGNSPKTKQNKGREYWHGLTREITIPIGTLAATQTTAFQTWAIAFHNEPGGYTIGKVWKDANNPDINKSTFPDGTVIFKLLFTEADTVQVPYLANAKKWTANIFTPQDAFKKRQDTNVRLLQLDVAIKDKRAEGFVEGEGQGTGWVYGTFVYDAANPGKTWLERMVPLGLMWGDDSGVNSMKNIYDKVNPDLKQSVINQGFVGAAGKKTNQGYVTHLGMGGRMNGPVDNPISSCISCHARAAIDEDGNAADLAIFSPKGYQYTDADMKDYFSTVLCDVRQITQKGKQYTTSDYSYQILKGIQFFKTVQRKPKANARGRLQSVAPLRIVSRDGD